MFLFRSTFITVISAFFMALCLFSISVSAVPQFGRPMLHALDAVTTASGLAEAIPTSAATGTGTNPDPDPQVVEAASSPSPSASSTATTTPVASGTSTNGASRNLGGGMSIMIGVVVSGVWLVF